MNVKHLGPRAAAAVLALAMSAVVAGPASAADVCISQQAKDNLAQCPGGKLQTTTQAKKHGVRFKPPLAPKTGEQQTKPRNPTAAMTMAPRDERRNRLAARSGQLLVTEIQGLESLFASTPKNAPDRPKLMRRLAEDYVELESAAFRDKIERGGKDAKADKIMKAARQAAIKYYTLLKNQYPRWCQNNNAANPAQSTGCADEVLYYLAYEHEQASQLEEARKVYLELIQHWPASKFIPNAYLAFGELFFNEAQGDPQKWSLAEQSYGKVVKYPPPDNKVWGYAHYKLAYVYWNQGDFARGISELKKTIEYGSNFAQLPNAVALANSARHDIVPLYALVGDPKKAYAFFKPLSGDKGDRDEATFKMMDELGQSYLDTGHYAEGIALYQDLMKRDRGSRSCLYQTHIAEATLALKSGNKDQIMSELGRMLELHDEFIRQDQPAGAKLKCSNMTADLLAETAMAWHIEAVGTGSVRGTGDKKTMSLAAELYDKIVKTFKKEDFAKFEFPRIVKEDWPDIFKIKYAMADLLYANKDWTKAGPAFDAVVAEDPSGPLAAEAAYAALLCYQKIYLEAHKDGSDRRGNGNLQGEVRARGDSRPNLAPKELTEAQKNMIAAFQRYLCYIKPRPDDKEAMEQYFDVKYALARTYFEAQHWEEAALAFREIAMDRADTAMGIYATQLYLESINVLGRQLEASRESCYADMEKDVPKFVELYCKGDKMKENEVQCGVLLRIERDLERYEAEKLVGIADKAREAGRSESETAKQYEKAAEAYLALWRKYGAAACENKEPGCERSDEVLYNAARAFQAARLIAKAIAVRKVLIDSKYNLQDTELAKKAVYEIGANYQAIAVYDLAAEWYERYASASPKAEKAADALQDATLLRLGLGQEEQAIKDAELFNRNYGTIKPALSAQIAFAVGAHYIEREDFAEARRRLSKSMSLIDHNATIDVQIQAHAMLGRAYTRLNSLTNASSEYNKVKVMWKDPKAAVEKAQAEGADERKIGKMLTAVGEALFFFAEQNRKKVDEIRFPVYKGSGNIVDVRRHITTRVADWMKKKQPAIEEAEKEYRKIVELEPAPPPKWVIAAGSRVGQMWGRFVAEFRAAPIPNEWKGEGLVPGTDLSYADVRGTYYYEIDRGSEPYKLRAKKAYETCLSYSVKYQYFDEYSRKCEEWLSKHYSAEYHLLDELRGSPSRINSGLSDRSAPVKLEDTWRRIEPRLRPM